jgi:predicted aspartyl protease
MPYLTLQLIGGRPLIDVAVGLSAPRAAALGRAQQLVSPPVQARALIDTGASSTCIDPQLLRALELAPVGQVRIQTPSTGTSLHLCELYDVSLSVSYPGIHIALPTLSVVAASIATQGIQCLIGRDILSRWLLIYDGGGRSFTVCV